MKMAHFLTRFTQINLLKNVDAENKDVLSMFIPLFDPTLMNCYTSHRPDEGSLIELHK